MLPCTSHTIRFLLVPRVRRGVGLSGVQERDLSSFAATSASSLDCSKTLTISLSSLSFSLALFLSSFWDFFIAHSRDYLSLSDFVLSSDLLSLSFLLFFLSLTDTSTSLVVISRRPTTAFNRTWRSPSCW